MGMKDIICFCLDAGGLLLLLHAHGLGKRGPARSCQVLLGPASARLPLTSAPGLEASKSTFAAFGRENRDEGVEAFNECVC